MARVTVEDCVDKVPNRFELVLLGSHRARAVAAGAPITVERDNDKNPVVALREIADQSISPEDVKEDLIHSMQKFVEVDEPEPEVTPLLTAEPRAVILGQDDPSSDRVIEPMSEEQLLRGMESLSPADSSNAGSRSR